MTEPVEKPQEDKPVEKKTQKREFESTFNGLTEWHNHLIGKLGLMILCKNDKVKVNGYIHSIDKFLEETLNREFKSPDKQDDLVIMRKHVSVLRGHVTEDFPENVSMTGGRRKGKSKSKSKSKGKGKSKAKAKGKRKSKSKSKGKKAKAW